ncbi:MAG: PDZ domain-containing protein [Propionibacteriaceae bacterium]|nr:PDZ domain-containing protein [Propionibacteriaceae bacterium]
MTKQTWTAAVAALLFIAFAAVIAMVPVPYVTWAPGATHDLLGTVDGRPAISVQGAATFPTSGELRMATVSVTRADASLTLPEALFSFWLPSREVLPREAVYPSGVEAAQLEEAQARLMGTSQDIAVVAALRAAGVKVVELPMVTTVVASGPANGKLKPGDLITAVDNQSVTSVREVQNAIKSHRVGDVVKFDVIRDGASLTQSITTRAFDTDPDVPEVGIRLSIGYVYDPVVTFGIDPQVGGSSAGLMFSLALYELLTPGSLVGGRIVAGTGTIADDGQVGAIGGVQEKLAAAEAAHATLFLIPRDNCSDDEEPHAGLQVVPVATMGEALKVLGDSGALAPDQLPRCP